MDQKTLHSTPPTSADNCAWPGTCTIVRSRITWCRLHFYARSRITSLYHNSWSRITILYYNTRQRCLQHYTYSDSWSTITTLKSQQWSTMPATLQLHLKQNHRPVAPALHFTMTPSAGFKRLEMMMSKWPAIWMIWISHLNQSQYPAIYRQLLKTSTFIPSKWMTHNQDSVSRIKSFMGDKDPTLPGLPMLICISHSLPAMGRATDNHPEWNLFLQLKNVAKQRCKSLVNGRSDKEFDIHLATIKKEFPPLKEYLDTCWMHCKNEWVKYAMTATNFNNTTNNWIRCPFANFDG